MSKKPLTDQELTDLTTGLHRLAHNLWWTWDQEAQEVFQELSPRGWQNLYHNAVAILHEVSEYELRMRLQDLDFAARVREDLAAGSRFVAALATPSVGGAFLRSSSALRANSSMTIADTQTTRGAVTGR